MNTSAVSSVFLTLSLLLPLCAVAAPRTPTGGIEGPPHPVELRKLSGGSLRLSFGVELSKPAPDALRLKEVVTELVRIRTAAEKETAEQRLRREYEARYGPPLVPLPESLENSPLVLALKRSPHYMGAGVCDAARELFESRLFVASLTLSVGMYFAAWLMPEPFFSKAFAATLTVRLALLVGVAELSRIAQAVMRLYQETRSVHSTAELEAAAEHFGNAMGGSALRVLLLVASYGLGKALPNVPENGLWGLLEKLGSPRFAVEGGMTLGTSTTVQIVADGSLVVTGAVAGVAAATLGSACGDGSEKKDGHQWHHIATDKNEIASSQGGPWTPQFMKLFQRAGMGLDAPENLVYLAGHKGPHPTQYHAEIYRKLREALGDCDTVETCRRNLLNELRALTKQICTPDTWLNSLATKN